MSFFQALGKSGAFRGTPLHDFFNPPDPQPAAVTPVVSDSNAAAEAEKQRKAAALAKGRASTILTGGGGLGETQTVERKKLLGE